MENKYILFDAIDEWSLSQLKDFIESSSGSFEILLSSGGGSVFDGIAMSGLIQRHSAKTTVTGVGFVASIATVVLLAADNVKLDKNAFIMIHNAWTFEAGEASGNLEIVLIKLADFTESQMKLKMRIKIVQFKSDFEKVIYKYKLN